jgi:hypothetical protein
MSSDLSGPIIDMPVGTTNTDHVASTCVPAEERHKKTLMFIILDDKTSAYLARLRAHCFCGPTAKLESEYFMEIPSTANNVKAAVNNVTGKTNYSNLNAAYGRLLFHYSITCGWD